MVSHKNGDPRSHVYRGLGDRGQLFARCQGSWDKHLDHQPANRTVRRIGRLEDELGLALFERGHAGIRLTSRGKAVLPHIRRALAEIDAIEHACDWNLESIVSEVRLAVRMPPVGEPLRELLSSWRERHPDVLVTVSEINEWEIQTAIRERRTDLALMPSGRALA